MCVRLHLCEFVCTKHAMHLGLPRGIGLTWGNKETDVQAYKLTDSVLNVCLIEKIDQHKHKGAHMNTSTYQRIPIGAFSNSHRP